jgi:hypothetical protein
MTQSRRFVVAALCGLLWTIHAGASELSFPTAAASDGVPVRADRKWAIAAEAGWNGLAGVGANLTYNLVPRLSLDLGLGLSTVGIKSGARLRANLLESELTPFVGAGFLYGSGTDNKGIEVESNGNKARARILPSPYLQVVAGINYTPGNGGFTFMATAGYALLLRHKNVEYVSGSTTAYKDFRDICGSGIVLGASVGYAF